MASPIAPPVGISGATIGCLCPSPRSRTGSRLGGKRARARMDTDYLDWALADFSGYIPTDGSQLYPAPIATVWGEVPHQLCEFHILADLSRAVLSAVAQVRKSLEARKPKVGRGRPTASTRKLVQQRQRLEQKISDLFTHRYLFVQRQLTASEQETFRQITRGLPQLRALREIMDEVYRLFARRRPTETP